jgi:hypothetical protein
LKKHKEILEKDTKMPISRARRSNKTSITVGERTPVTTVSTGTLIRSMRQTNTGTDTPLLYEFHFGISTFTHDSSGVLYTEIPRPLNLPLVDATSQKLERCSFEFLIAVPYDSLGSSVDEHITLLQDFANQDRTVQFSNVHSALSVKPWNIDSITFQITRVNESGKATAATCNMSLVESIERTERFVKLPKFTYEIPKGSGLSTSSTGGPGSGIGAVGNIVQIESLGRGNVVVVTTQTNHGLTSGQFVVIAFNSFIVPPNVIALATPNKPYEISANAITPTKFTYIKSVETGDSPASFVAPYGISPGNATYTVTGKVVKQTLYTGSRSADVIERNFIDKSTKGPTDKTVSIGSQPVTLGPDLQSLGPEYFFLQQRLKTYLYSLKIENPSLYAENIGDTSSVAYQKAISYLTQVSYTGKNPNSVKLEEIVRNIG